MRTNITARMGTTLVAAFVLAGSANAQHNKIADQDLLNLMESVNESETPDVADVEEVSQAAPVVEQVAIEANTPEEAVVEEMPVVMEEIPVMEEVPAVSDEPVVVEETVVEAEEVDAVGMESPGDENATTAGNLISVRLNRVGLEEAINLFAQLSGANIIVPELTEAAQISVNLKDVEWRPALQSILDTYNYELYQRVSGSNVYSVRRRPAGAPEPQVVETFLLKYATVPNAAALVKELLPPDAKVSEFASRNMLVVKSTESSLSEVRSVLETIDTVRQQVYIESKFMELTDDAQKDLGIDWSVLQAYSLGTKGKPTYDYGRRQTETQLTDDGGSSYQEADSFLAPGGTLPSGGPVFEGLTPTKADITTEVLTSVLDADEFRIVMSALQSNKGINIVSNPKVIVANEEKANISIVRKEPNLRQSRQQALNDSPDTVVFELDPERPFFDFGIKLDVTPSINTSSNITVQIVPSLTRKYADKPAGDNTYPVIDEKSIQTVFNLASGQTAAIGGLTTVTEGEEEKKVPLLGSIPFLGRLFSWKQNVQGQDETIIFVTVGLANTQILETDTGIPEDSELARRQLIKEANQRELRHQGRGYYQSEEEDKKDDLSKVMEQKEQQRIDHRLKRLQKEQEKEARKAK